PRRSPWRRGIAVPAPPSTSWASAPLAAFQASINGRFWVSTEDREGRRRALGADAPWSHARRPLDWRRRRQAARVCCCSRYTPDRPKMETTVRRALLVAGWTALLAAPAPAVTIEWVPIGNPGNAPVPTKCFVPDCGSVAYEYSIVRYETTNAQYAEFL